MDTDGDTEGSTSALTAASLPQPMRYIQAPSTVPLGQAFNASVVTTSAGLVHASDMNPYQWGGEGLSVSSASGALAKLTCTWSGFHTIEVTATALPASAPLTAQVYCSPPLCEGSPENCPGVKLLPEQALACPKTNLLVRRRTNQECESEIQPIPGVSGSWLGGFLLDAPDSAQAVQERFCSYSWSGLPTQPPVPPSSAVDWQWDCPRIAAQGSSNELNAALAAYGQAELDTIQWKSNPTDDAPVRIAVVDTAAHLWKGPDNNPHGKAVGMLAFDTACADQKNCKVAVENYLGLPLYREQRGEGPAIVRRDPLHGGSFGAQGDLIRAIYRAIDAAPNVRTVLNLSLGYEAHELQDSLLPTRGDFANRSVLAALRYARCNGVLILAAAANGPVPAEPGQTPGFPARWTGLSALSKAECLARFGVARYSGDSPGPLLYAVSGLDFAARPLLTTRGAGLSAIAALGFEVVRRLPNGSYTRRMTGTSMATAAVSGIAASLWSRVPSLSPDALMLALYAQGSPTSIAPDFAPYPASSPDNPYKEVRGITRCSIAKAFPDLADCVYHDLIPDPSVPGGTVPTLPASSPEQSASEPGASTPGVRPEDLPWLFPQPTPEPGCGACRISLSQLSLAFRFSFPLSSVNNMRLLARSSTSLTQLAFAANLVPIISTEEIIAAGVPAPQIAPFNVSLDDSFAHVSAAELSYQISVDDKLVDVTESVLIE
jgi:subtilisin family serine protease